MSLEQNFRNAAQDVQRLAAKPNNDDLLVLYSLYKQAEHGPVNGKRPGALNVVARRKYDQWAALGDMSQQEAMEKYIAKVRELESASS